MARELANRSGDDILKALSELTRAEALALQGRDAEFGALIDEIRPVIARLPIDLLGQYERIIGSALATRNNRAGEAHFARAARAFDALQHRPGQIQLHRASQAAGLELGKWQPAAQLDPMRAGHGARVVQDILTMLLHVGRPELLATDVIDVLAATSCVARATAVARHDDGRVENLAAHAMPISSSSVAALPSRTYLLGRAGNRSVEVTCEPLHTVESIATVNAVASLLEVVRDLDAARMDREERLGLWPVEELPDSEDDALIAGEMREVMRMVRRAAPTTAAVLITGESGTGKEIVARAVHRFSKGAGWPFVPFNCTAVPRDLLESHLFGHRRGAFTGADRDHPGVVRTSKDGTLFLDEVGELSPDMQPKLLRFLESNEITPLGESEPVHVKTRVVAATNANLETLIQQGKFRSDLFYRLRVVPIHIPPLRDRRDEIPSLARFFVARAAALDSKGQLTLADDAIELMTLYSWPGNVRQLNNEIRRMVALADNDATLTADMLSPEIRRGRVIGPDEDVVTVSFDGTLTAATERLEREMIGAALRKHSGRLDDTARALGLSRKGLYLKRLRLGL